MTSVVRPAESSPEKAEEVWRTKRVGSRDLPSPIVVGNVLFVVSMQGVATAYEASTGKLLSRARLGGNFSASPIAAGGKIYLPSEAGEVLVIEAGESEGIYLAQFDMDQIRDYRQRETWGNAFRRPHRYGELTSTRVREPLIRVNARGERYDTTKR